MPPPSLFYLTLAVFHLFPLHSPITLWGLDAPFGRFASKSSRWNLNGMKFDALQCEVDIVL